MLNTYQEQNMQTEFDTPQVTINESATSSEKEKFECKTLDTYAQKELYRSVLSQIEAEAFKNDPRHQEMDSTLIQEMPDSMYFSKDTMIVVLENPDTKIVEGFTLLEKRDDTTYYETMICTVHTNKGYGTKILNERDQILKQVGVKHILTHVDTDGDYARYLEKRYKSVELHDKDDAFMGPNQKALRLEL